MHHFITVNLNNLLTGKQNHSTLVNVETSFEVIE